MREAPNQHNIFIRRLICQPCMCAVAHIKFKRHQPLARAGARQTIPRRIEKRAMRRTNQLIAQSVQKPVGEGLKRQTQMRAPVHETAKSPLCVPDDEVKAVGALWIRNQEAARFFRPDSFCWTNDRAAGGEPHISELVRQQVGHELGWRATSGVKPRHFAHPLPFRRCYWLHGEARIGH